MKLRQNLIEKLRDGKICLKNTIGENIELLRQILKEAFTDKCVPAGNSPYYFRNESIINAWSSISKEPNEMEVVPILDFIGGKIIGYKAPFDFCGGNIKKGDVFKKSPNEWYYGLDGKTQWQQPNEIVETWEPVYEEKTSIRIKVGNRDVIITNDGTIKGTKNYKISNWQNLYNALGSIKLYSVLGLDSYYQINIENFSIGCEKNINLKDVENVIAAYYELNDDEDKIDLKKLIGTRTAIDCDSYNEWNTVLYKLDEVDYNYAQCFHGFEREIASKYDEGLNSYIALDKRVYSLLPVADRECYRIIRASEII